MKILEEKILTVEDLGGSSVEAEEETFKRNLIAFDKLYTACKEAVTFLKNMEILYVRDVNLPEMELFDKTSQTSPIEGLVSEPATEDEIKFLSEVNEKLGAILANAV